MIHPSGEDPFNHPLVLAEYVHSELWVGIHIGQFVGTMMVFVGGFITIYRLLANAESSIISLLGLIGFALAIITASTFAILQAVDGVALKFGVDSWMGSSGGEEDKDSYSAFAYPNFEGIRGISMIIFLVWCILLVSVMLKKTTTRGIREKTNFYLKYIC